MIATRQRAEAARRRAEDLGIAVDIIMRSVPAIDDLIAALDGAGGSVRLVGALRAELARQRGGGRR
jgi:predicted RecB family endonuclease